MRALEFNKSENIRVARGNGEKIYIMRLIIVTRARWNSRRRLFEREYTRIRQPRSPEWCERELIPSLIIGKDNARKDHENNKSLERNVTIKKIISINFVLLHWILTSIPWPQLPLGPSLNSTVFRLPGKSRPKEIAINLPKGEVERLIKRCRVRTRSGWYNIPGFLMPRPRD